MAQEDLVARPLAWDACYNVRDLGGYPTMSGRRIRPQALVRADNLNRLSSAGQAALRAYGVRTIIDLRLDHEVERDPNPFAASQGPAGEPRYLRLPLLDPETDAALDAVESPREQYILIVERNKERVAAVVKAVAASLEAGGVLVHCHGGKDRTGIVVALLLSLVGAPRGTIVDDYALTEARLEAPNRIWLEEQSRIAGRPLEKPEWMFARPETIAGLLDYLDTAHGGVAGYLAATGVTQNEMAQVRERLTAP
jgi:protein-tyrosine phosphatase